MLFQKFKSGKFFSQAALLILCITAVNAGNYLINILLGKFLGPELFAEASVLATSVLVISFIAVSFQLTVAKYVSINHSSEENDQCLAVYAYVRSLSLKIGGALVILLLIFSPVLQSFLHFRSIIPLWILILSIPLYFVMSVQRGYLQGIQSFGKLTLTYTAEMIGRLVLTMLIIIVLTKLAPKWISEGIAFSFAISFIAAFIVGSSLDLNSATQNLSPSVKTSLSTFLLLIGFYEFSQIAINHSDLILVKHYFSNEIAGGYAALALIGRIVFFATWSVVLLLIPKVVEKKKSGEAHQSLFFQSLAIVGFIGLAISLICFFSGNLIMNYAFGAEYASMSDLLGWYALSTCLYACANVFAYYYMSLNNYFPAGLTLLAGLLQIIAICNFHQSIEQIIKVQLLLMVLLILKMIIFHTIKNLSNEKIKNRLRFSFSTR